MRVIRAPQRARRSAVSPTVVRMLDSCCSEIARRAVNGAEWWDELTAMLRAQQVDLVAVEAIGGHERGSVNALQGAGISVDQNTRTEHSHRAPGSSRKPEALLQQMAVELLVVP